MKTLKMFKLFVSFMIISMCISCNQEDDNPISSVTEGAIYDESKISKEQIEELGKLIETGKFDKEIAAVESGNAKLIGDGREGGNLEFDFTNRRLILKGFKTGELCPNRRVNGDREFGGGPLVTVGVHMIYFPQTNALYAYIDFRAQETKNDFSELRFSSHLESTIFIRNIYGIDDIVSPLNSGISYRARSARPRGIRKCKDGPIDEIDMRFSLVKKFRIIGDTSGNDISTDNNCKCHTKIVNIEFDDIVMSF